VVKESGVVMRRTTLTQIIVPLATSYLCVEKFAKVNSLIDSAIDVSFLGLGFDFLSNSILYLSGRGNCVLHVALAGVRGDPQIPFGTPA
jgi:hypothetical protein